MVRKKYVRKEIKKKAWIPNIFISLQKIRRNEYTMITFFPVSSVFSLNQRLAFQLYFSPTSMHSISLYPIFTHPISHIFLFLPINHTLKILIVITRSTIIQIQALNKPNNKLQHFPFVFNFSCILYTTNI